MSKPANVARYTLPDVVEPSDSVCFVVPVPNDKFHIAAFKGQIKALASAYTWANDPSHTAVDVAHVWREIFDNLENCDMVAIRLKPTDFCMIQLSLDGGSTWADVADLSACAHAAAIDEINDARLRGDIAGGSQQPGQGEGTPGACYDYFITLRANDRWHCPVAVIGGDIITVDGESGAWFDGNGLAPAWRCADGSLFVLGACTLPGATDSGDPAPTVDHMRIIGNLPEYTTTPYFDMFDTVYTVPTSVPDGEFFLQANDSDLSDNQGSINLHVQVCKGVWTSDIDYTLSAWASFTTISGGSFVSGTGIVGQFFDSFSQNDATIVLNITTATIFEISVTWSKTAESGVNGLNQVGWAKTGGGSGIFGSPFPGTGSHVTSVLTANHEVNVLAVDSNTGTSPGTATIERLFIRGVGAKPPELP